MIWNNALLLTRCAVWSLLMLSTVSSGAYTGVCVCVQYVLYEYPCIHATQQCCYLCMPHVKATKWPIWETAVSADHAPISPSPVLMDSMRILCVNVCSLCVNVSVCVSLLDNFLWLWRWTGSGKECFFSSLIIAGSGGHGGCIILFFLTAVGAFWKEKEFEPRYWERRLRCITSVANETPG